MNNSRLLSGCFGPQFLFFLSLSLSPSPWSRFRNQWRTTTVDERLRFRYVDQMALIRGTLRDFFFLEHREPSLKGEKGTRLLSNFTRPTGPVSNSLTRSQHPLEAKLRQQHQVQEPKQQPCHENSKTFFFKKKKRQ